MDPILKLWYYNHWVQDQNDKIELTKNHAYLVASFFNPEGVKAATSDAGKFSTTDEEFEESTKMVLESSKNQEKVKKKNPRKKLKVKE